MNPKLKVFLFGCILLFLVGLGIQRFGLLDSYAKNIPLFQGGKKGEDSGQPQRQGSKGNSGCVTTQNISLYDEDEFCTPKNRKRQIITAGTNIEVLQKKTTECNVDIALIRYSGIEGWAWAGLVSCK